MKFTSAIFTGLLAIASATPIPKDIEVLVAVKVADTQQTPNVTPMNRGPQGPCFLICLSEQPQCPENWGDCWTCCLNIPDSALNTINAAPVKQTEHKVVAEVAQHKLQTPLKIDSRFAGICLLVCWPKANTCPADWTPTNFGTDDNPCWTCCRSADHSPCNIARGARSILDMVFKLKWAKGGSSVSRMEMSNENLGTAVTVGNSD
ncbi:hypothetical protein BDZ45DRAFT_730682 [Acephala macrosclerotiorum]|nr:hypothetical protein BDZ45DRAFT_730682 [Acephala macrosclerotiorum]